MDENSFEHEGVTYHAIHRKTCRECYFEFTEPCTVLDQQPWCMASMRKDGEDVIWKKQDNQNGWHKNTAYADITDGNLPD